jgi:hypothetical protein
MKKISMQTIGVVFADQPSYACHLKANNAVIYFAIIAFKVKFKRLRKRNSYGNVISVDRRLNKLSNII